MPSSLIRRGIRVARHIELKLASNTRALHTGGESHQNQKMIFDGRKVANGRKLVADLCIVGAGPAGITLAREFRHQSVSVIVLEAGGFEFDTQTQDSYKGQAIGNPYPPLDLCRRRVFGGTTSIWGGWCRPLDAIDFVQRDWVPWSGWPLSKEDLEPDYQRALALCRIPVSRGDFPGCPPSSDSDAFEIASFTIAPASFGRVYRAEFARATNISVIMHATALEIRLNSEGTSTDSIRVGSDSGNEYSVAARCFVLAAGGIENARLMLVSRGTRSIGVGNEHDLVGRFFSDHLHFYGDLLEEAPSRAIQIFRPRGNRYLTIRGCLALTEAARRRERLLGFAATGHNARDPHDVVAPATGHAGYAALSLVCRSFARGRIPDRLGAHLHDVIANLDDAFALALYRAWKPKWRSILLGCRAEQTPNPSSRVLLDDNEKDAFGIQRAKLDWRLTAEDFSSLNRAYELLRTEAMLPYCTAHSPARVTAFTGASHHIGTTRMHRNPKFGVVNSDCRVHSVANLFIAGSSVFPTGGWAPPTLTIVALAVRLAKAVQAFIR